MSDLRSAIDVAATGMRAQSERMKIVAQNIANADSVGASPNQDPYRRQTITFKNEYDRAVGAEVVMVAKRSVDPSPFGYKYQPGHPAADEHGYVRTPNVDSLIEKADLKEAQRSYEANLAVIEATKSMLGRTLDLLR
ncbi:MAG: flagellar basal body rod protein FlgC [Hyphomicrobiales bacterium]|nr:flagellar basal body rod protein FlgC [Hyphomicrobiales bacterium]